MRDYYGKVFERYTLRDTVIKFFEKYDILLSPVLPVTELDAGVDIPLHLGDRNLVSWVFYTYPFNLTGNPAASICAGVSKGGMPVGLQSWGARTVTHGSRFRENAEPWLQYPPISRITAEHDYIIFSPPSLLEHNRWFMFF